MKAKALCMVSPRVAELVDAEVHDPGDHEILVRTLASGICMWDVKAFEGRIPVQYPYVGGHEGVGRVVSAGAGVTGVRVGDIVTTWSKRAFCEYFVVADTHALRVDAPDPQPELWISEPAKCAVTGATHVGIVPGDTVALIGCGYMGLLHLQLVPKAWTTHLIAVDVNEERLRLALDLGATAAIRLEPGHDGEVVRRVLELCPRGVDIAIEAAGVPGTLALATQLVRPGGTLSIFGYHAQPETVDTGTWHLKGLRVLNTTTEIGGSSVREFRSAVALMHKGVIDQRRLVTHTFDFYDAPEVMRMLADARPPGYMKGAFVFGERGRLVEGPGEDGRDRSCMESASCPCRASR